MCHYTKKKLDSFPKLHLFFKDFSILCYREVLHIHNGKKAVLHSNLHNTSFLLQHFWVVEEKCLDIVLDIQIGKEPVVGKQYYTLTKLLQ